MNLPRLQNETLTEWIIRYMREHARFNRYSSEPKSRVKSPAKIASKLQRKTA